jgi:hypothetical protein
VSYKNVLLCVCLLLGINSCTSDNAEDLYPPDPCIVEAVNFTEDIEPIISNNCYRCHDAATTLGGVNLEGFTNVLTYVSNEKLIGTIRDLPGYPLMPNDGQPMSECDIKIIEHWITLGTPEN